MACTIPGLDAILVNVAWSTSPLSATPDYQNVAYPEGEGKFHGCSINRGRSYEAERFSAGTMELKALDFDRDFETAFSGSPYYPDIKPRRKIQFIAVRDGIEYPRFTGFTRKILNRYDQFGMNPRTVLPATDGFLALSKKRITGSFATEESSGTRIANILDAVGWPGSGLTTANHRALDAGNFSIQSQDLDDTSALEAIYHVELSEWGRFFIAASGAATFLESRAFHLNSTYRAVQDTFGDSPAGAELYYEDISFALDDERIHNRVTASRVGGVTQEAADEASIEEYFETVEPVPELLLLTDNEAFDYAHYRLGRESQPQVRVEPIRVNPLSDPENLWPVCLADNLQRRFRVVKRPRAGGPQREVEVHIEGIQDEWDFQAGTAYFTFQMSISDPSTPWIVEAPGVQLGINTYSGR
jgi:hypothetical protein